MEASVADCDLEVLTAIETVYNLEEVKAKKISNKLPKKNLWKMEHLGQRTTNISMTWK